MGRALLLRNRDSGVRLTVMALIGPSFADALCDMGECPCPVPSVGLSAFACPACRRGALMVAAGLHGDAQTGSISLME